MIPKPRYYNDTSAPRMGKAEYTTNIVTKELWVKFCKDYPEHNLTFSEFLAKWLHVAETIRQETATNDLGVKLGAYTGELKTQYYPNKVAGGVMHAVSDEMGQEIRDTRILTRGKAPHIRWERRWAVKFNKMLQFFSFEHTRDIQIRAAKHIDEFPEKLRVARNTLGGFSIWRQL